MRSRSRCPAQCRRCKIYSTSRLSNSGIHLGSAPSIVTHSMIVSFLESQYFVLLWLTCFEDCWKKSASLLAQKNSNMTSISILFCSKFRCIILRWLSFNVCDVQPCMSRFTILMTFTERLSFSGIMLVLSIKSRDSKSAAWNLTVACWTTSMSKYDLFDEISIWRSNLMLLLHSVYDAASHNPSAR